MYINARIPTHSVFAAPRERRPTIRSFRRFRIAHTTHITHASSFTDFMKDLSSHQVESAFITQDKGEVSFTTKDGEKDTVIVPSARSEQVLEALIDNNVPVTFIPDDNLGARISGAFSIFIQLVFVGVIIQMFLISRSARGGSGGIGGSFGITSAQSKEINPDEVKTRFADVAGVENAKTDLQEVVDFLKNSAKFTRVGAKVPKGVLLVGMPGTGKTLLARAVAGEAGVPFFDCPASTFVELFVGTGAARVRDLFRKANEKAPCIIFIDEIDAIGKARGSSNITGNDEREQTINQLLTAMDGFAENSRVIVIAATNRPDILDEALLRPGRFDRKVTVEMPDFVGRTAILKIHTAGKPLDSDVDIEKIARNTVGFSGADLANLANEAAIYAARDGKDKITTAHWDSALEKITIGEERRTLLVSEQKRKVIAYHEAGHALMGVLVDDFDVIRKVSIVPRGDAGGITYFEPSEERVDGGLVSQNYLLNQLMVALGGRIAEEIVFGTMNATNGASGDLTTVMHIAYNMVAAYGFNENLGTLNWVDAPVDRSSDIASEMQFLVDRSYSKAYELLEKHECYLHRIANALLEKETLLLDDIRALTSDMTTEISASSTHNENRS